MKVAAVILARMGSTRLERKVLRELCGMPLVAHVIKRACAFPGLDGEVPILAIPRSSENDELEDVGRRCGARVFRGDENNVLERLLLAAVEKGADVVYRVTADNPLVDPGVASLTWEAFIDGEWDYAVMEGVPLGTTCEIVTTKALSEAQKFAVTPHLKEHPTLALYENSRLFKMKLVNPPSRWAHPEWRLTVDTEQDFKLVERIMGEVGIDATLDEIVPFLESNPELVEMNLSVEQRGWDELQARKRAIHGS